MQTNAEDYSGAFGYKAELDGQERQRQELHVPRWLSLRRSGGEMGSPQELPTDTIPPQELPAEVHIRTPR